MGLPSRIWLKPNVIWIQIKREIQMPILNVSLFDLTVDPAFGANFSRFSTQNLKCQST
jgi:hypothetical protein